jgi:hypothetical protein
MKKRSLSMNSIHCRRALRATFSVLGLTLALTAACVAQTAGNESAKPIWPNNGIAQRMLPGAYNMFVEQDEHGQWHAWAMNGVGKDAQAVDFFSGKQIHVEAGIDDYSAQQTRDFVDSSGVWHGPQSRRFMFSHSGLLGGVTRGGDLLDLDGANCPVSFIGIEGGVSENDPMGNHPKWIRVPIYREAPGMRNCPSGSLYGSLHTFLDLEDGTFLATGGCWVFRLRKSDLSPVGAAPGLRIVDEAALQAAIDQAKGKDIQDASAYLAKALNLSFDAANTCKSDEDF